MYAWSQQNTAIDYNDMPKVDVCKGWSVAKKIRWRWSRSQIIPCSERAGPKHPEITKWKNKLSKQLMKARLACVDTEGAR